MFCLSLKIWTNSGLKIVYKETFASKVYNMGIQKLTNRAENTVKKNHDDLDRNKKNTDVK